MSEEVNLDMDKDELDAVVGRMIKKFENEDEKLTNLDVIFILKSIRRALRW